MLFKRLLYGSALSEICHTAIVHLFAFLTLLQHFVHILRREDHDSIYICNDNIVRIDRDRLESRLISVALCGMNRDGFLQSTHPSERRLTKGAVSSGEYLQHVSRSAH